VQKRAEQPLLAHVWSLDALRSRLPLVFPVDPALPPSPKRRYRSAYRPPDPAALPAPSQWGTLSDFELALGLIDCSPLERLLATSYVPSAKGQTPFHPVSLFLCLCLRRELDLGWRALARLLASEHGAAWRRRFGFAEGVTPSASGLRSFFQAVGPAVFAELCPRFVALLRQHGLCPERSTYPGDPPARGVSVCQDGQLHPARHQHTCRWATDTCVQPLPPTADRGLEGSPGAARASRATRAAPAPRRPANRSARGPAGWTPRRG
jgi:hypothetical protein